MKLHKTLVLFSLLIGILIFNNCKKKEKEAEPAAITTNTPSNFATITAAAPFGITEYSASCSVTVSAEGTSALTAVGICWNTATSPTTLNSKTNNGAGVGAFTATIGGLQPNTTYFVRSYATNASGTVYGSEVTFKTQDIWTSVAGPSNFTVLASSIMVDNSVTLIGYNGSSPYGIKKITGPQNAVQSYGTNQSVSDIKKRNSYIFAGTSDGVLKSSDDGATWISVSGIVGNYPFHISSNTTKMFVSTADNGVYSTNDDGATWQQCNNGLADLNIKGLVTEGTKVWASTPSGMYYSSDNGATWSLVSSSITTCYVLGAWPGYLLIDNGSGLYKSIDNGATWVQITNAITGNLAIHIVGNKIYLGGFSSSGVYFSEDGGVTWAPTNIGLAGGVTRAFYVYNSDIYVCRGYGLYKRTF